MAANDSNPPRRRQNRLFTQVPQVAKPPRLGPRIDASRRQKCSLHGWQVLDMTRTPGRIGWLCIEITLPTIIFFFYKFKILQVLIYKTPILWPHCIFRAGGLRQPKFLSFTIGTFFEYFRHVMQAADARSKKLSQLETVHCLG